MSLLKAYLDKALVEAEVVPDGVLPALLVAPVVREVLDDELVDAVEGQALLRALYRNRDTGHTWSQMVTSGHKIGHNWSYNCSQLVTICQIFLQQVTMCQIWF